MKESFKRNKEKPQMSRRGFLKGFGSSLLSGATVGGVWGALKFKDAEESDALRENYDTNALEELLENTETNVEESKRSSSEESMRAFEGHSNSKHFIMEIVRHADRYDRELPIVLQFAQTPTMSDPLERSRMEYLHETLDAKGVPEEAMDEIRKQVVGLALEESRYDAQRQSGEQAQGILQIIPSTWDDLSREGESVLSLVDQTRVAGELLSQTYAHLQNAAGDDLKAIEAEFFHGDEAAFEKYFLAPVLINAYNAGMGTMAKLVQWFARTYGTEEKTVGLFGQEEMLSGYDVFLAMAKKAGEEKAVPLYREDASAYTFKVYGAALCLLRSKTDTSAA